MNQTHTYAVLEVSPLVYAAIKDKLKAAGYDHAFHKVGRQAIDELLECDPGDPGKFRAIGNG